MGIGITSAQNLLELNELGLLKDFNGTTDQIVIYLKSSRQDLANFFLSLSFFMRIDSTQDLTLILS